jgi:SAM-dependent methyltransferase
MVYDGATVKLKQGARFTSAVWKHRNTNRWRSSKTRCGGFRRLTATSSTRTADTRRRRVSSSTPDAGLAAFFVCGVDADQGACVAASAKSGACVFRGNVARLPFATGTVDAMFNVDVLCHADVDPPATLVEARRCLRPGGILFLNLPAYMWMRSAHDERVHNSRRFTRAGAAVMLQNAGFGIRAAAYWNALLFPMMATHRLLNRGGHGRRESDVRVFPKPIDRAFRAVLAIERRLIASGLNAPFGGSILVVAVNGG